MDPSHLPTECEASMNATVQVTEPKPCIDLYFFPHETLAVHPHAKQCPMCGAMSFIWSNRFGASSCIGCADLMADELGLLRTLKEVA